MVQGWAQEGRWGVCHGRRVWEIVRDCGCVEIMEGPEAAAAFLRRRCERCREEWWSPHCRHEVGHEPCLACGGRGVVVEDGHARVIVQDRETGSETVLGSRIMIYAMRPESIEIDFSEDVATLNAKVAAWLREEGMGLEE